MYFLSFDFLHTILALSFLLTVWGMVFFRYRKYLIAKETTVNYRTSKGFSVLRLASLALSLSILGIILLGPRGLMKDSPTGSQGIDCIWLLDVSSSMDVTDVTEDASTVSRLTKAKSLMENYIISHPENRYGLVIFAGKSRVISPLTTEYSSLLTFLASIDSKSIREGGTDFRDALQTTLERFETKDTVPHAIVLLSDGGDVEDSPDMNSIRDIFQGKRANLTTIGLGQTTLSPIPTGKNPLGDTVYKKFQGETVLSGLNRGSLKNLAEIGKGSYLEGTSIPKNLERSLSAITHHALQDSGDDSNDMTVRILTLFSFFFFLFFLLFPSSFMKRGNAL